MSVPRSMHKEAGPKTANFFVITVSTSRFNAKVSGQPYTDESGDLAESMLKQAGQRVVGRELIKDDLVMIRSLVDSLLLRDDVDVIVLTGGTGLARSDVTIEPLGHSSRRSLRDLANYLDGRAIKRLVLAS